MLMVRLTHSTLDGSFELAPKLWNANPVNFCCINTIESLERFDGKTGIHSEIEMSVFV